MTSPSKPGTANRVCRPQNGVSRAPKPIRPIQGGRVAVTEPAHTSDGASVALPSDCVELSDAICQARLPVLGTSAEPPLTLMEQAILDSPRPGTGIQKGPGLLEGMPYIESVALLTDPATQASYNDAEARAYRIRVQERAIIGWLEAHGILELLSDGRRVADQRMLENAIRVGRVNDSDPDERQQKPAELPQPNTAPLGLRPKSRGPQTDLTRRIAQKMVEDIRCGRVSLSELGDRKQEILAADYGAGSRDTVRKALRMAATELERETTPNSGK